MFHSCLNIQITLATLAKGPNQCGQQSQSVSKNQPSSEVKKKVMVTRKKRSLSSLLLLFNALFFLSTVALSHQETWGLV